MPKTLPDKGPVDRRAGGLHPVIAIEVPSDSLGAEVIRAPQMNDFLHDFCGELPRMALRDGPFPHQPRFALSGVGLPPPVEAGPRHVKELTGLSVVSNSPSVLQDHLLTPKGEGLLDDGIPIHGQNLLVVS